MLIYTKSVLSFCLVVLMAYSGLAQCKTDAHKSFHFWVGKWEVTNPNGTPAGSNLITLSQDSCLMIEKWTSATGNYTGTSFNFYDRLTSKWHQTWVDNKGGHLQLSGQLDGYDMVLWSKPTKNSAGIEITNKITWTPNADGTVRQHWQIRQKDSLNWTTSFDGLYKKQ